MRSVFLVSILLFVLVGSGLVTAISLSPGIYRFQYDELRGLDEEVSFHIRSRSNQQILIETSATYGLAEYLSFEVDNFTLNPGESREVKVRLNIPPGLDKVDVHEARATFSKKPVVTGDEGFMLVTTALAGRLIVTFAYPGQYVLVTKLEPRNVNVGEDTTISWELQAKGMEQTSVEASLQIFDSSGNSVFQRDLPSAILDRNERASGTVDVPSSGFGAGNYDVLLEASSRDNSVNESAVLRIGEEGVALTSFNPKNYSSDEVLKFSFSVESTWNGVFNNVYGVLEFDDVSVVTRSVSLGPFEEKSIENQYIDLRHLGTGIHEGSLTIFFDGNEEVFDIELEAISPRNFSGFALFAVIIVVVLILVAVLLLFLFKKSKK